MPKPSTRKGIRNVVANVPVARKFGPSQPAMMTSVAVRAFCANCVTTSGQWRKGRGPQVLRKHSHGYENRNGCTYLGAGSRLGWDERGDGASRGVPWWGVAQSGGYRCDLFGAWVGTAGLGFAGALPISRYCAAGRRGDDSGLVDRSSGGCAGVPAIWLKLNWNHLLARAFSS